MSIAAITSDATALRHAQYARDFPLAKGESAHWTDRIVTEGHAAYCRTFGHAFWEIDGVRQDICPRCGK